MTYQVVLTPLATKQIEKLPQNIQPRIRAKIRDLADNPRPSGVKKLKSSIKYRVRVGDYRIVYEIQDDVLVVTVVRVGHRKDVYE